MKKSVIKVILTVLIFVAISIPGYAYADVVEPLEINIRSYGNIIYEDENGSVKIYAEDIAFLKEKLSSISEDIFNPAFYSRIHEWKYIDVNEKAHTQQCGICSATLTNVHKAVGQEESNFIYSNKTYDGYNYVCKCDYTWSWEREHNYVYTFLDAEKHMAACELDGTKYCEGLTGYEEEHVLNIVSGTDNTHKVTCSICLYERNEDCNFTNHFRDETTGEDRMGCECGNYVVFEGNTDSNLEPYQENGNSISSNDPNLQI